MLEVGLHAGGFADTGKDLALELGEFRRELHVLMALGRQRHLVDRIDAPGAGRHQHDAAAQIDGFFDIVGDEQDGAFLQPVHVTDQVVHDFAGLRIQRAERLVHQQCRGFGQQGAGNGNALLHAAGELAGVGIGEARQAHQVEQGIGAAGGRLHVSIVAHGVADHLELAAELDVLHHRQPGIEAVVLEDHGAVDARAVDRLAVEQDLATTQRFQPGDDAQQGGLAAARGPDEGDELVGLDIQVDRLQRLHLALLADEGLADLTDMNLGIGHGHFLIQGKARRCNQRKA